MKTFMTLLIMMLLFVCLMLGLAYDTALGCDPVTRYESTGDQLEIAYQMYDYNCDGKFDQLFVWVIDEDGTWILESTEALFDTDWNDKDDPVGIYPYYGKYYIQEI